VVHSSNGIPARRHASALLVLVSTLAVGCGGRTIVPDSTPRSDGAVRAPEAGETGTTTRDGGNAGAAGADASAMPPSCAPGGPGLSQCGTYGDNCCTSVAVAGGTFFRAFDQTGGAPPTDPAAVSSFRLDKFAVTVGRFRQFVAAWRGGWTPPAGSGKHTHVNAGLGLVDVAPDAGVAHETGWRVSDNGQVAPTDENLIDGLYRACATAAGGFATWTSATGPGEKRPINCVNWYEASAFCIWDGGFLPSEAEYEYAAAGGGQQRRFPWGATDPGTTLNQYAIYGDSRGNCYFPNGLAPCAPTSIAPVGSAPLGAGLFGQLDLAGNMYQLVLDWFADFRPSTDGAYLTAPEPDFRLTAVSSRVVRGSHFSVDTEVLRTSFRNAATDPTRRDIGVGFRCARTP
jgi:sulfatase modifying factor 1